MERKRKYTSPACMMTEVGAQSLMAGTSIRVDNTSIDGIGGDVNRNEDYDIWSNSDMYP